MFHLLFINSWTHHSIFHLVQGHFRTLLGRQSFQTLSSLDSSFEIESWELCSDYLKVEFVGHIVSFEGILTSPAKTKAEVSWAGGLGGLKNITNVRSFLGFFSYYRKFVKNFASIAKPLQEEKNQLLSRCEDLLNIICLLCRQQYLALRNRQLTGKVFLFFPCKITWQPLS